MYALISVFFLKIQNSAILPETNILQFYMQPEFLILPEPDTKDDLKFMNSVIHTQIYKLTPIKSQKTLMQPL